MDYAVRDADIKRFANALVAHGFRIKPFHHSPFNTQTAIEVEWASFGELVIQLENEKHDYITLVPLSFTHLPTTDVIQVAPRIFLPTRVALGESLVRCERLYSEDDDEGLRGSCHVWVSSLRHGCGIDPYWCRGNADLWRSWSRLLSLDLSIRK